MLNLQLEKARRRFDGGEPQKRYRFEVVERRAVPADGGEGGPAPAG